MAFTPKSWQNAPSTSTPLSAAALADLETRVTNIGLGGAVGVVGIAPTYTATPGDVVNSNPTSGGATITLPAVAASTTVTVYAGVTATAANTTTIVAPSGSIFGAGLLRFGASSMVLGEPLTGVCLTSDGSNWIIVSDFRSNLAPSRQAVNIAASESRTNSTYGTLTTPDQATVYLPTNGLITVLYQATWQESVIGAARAALFVGGNVVSISSPGDANTVPAAQISSPANLAGNLDRPLYSTVTGLASQGGSVAGYNGDAPPQVVGGTLGPGTGGPCYIFAAAGTYVVSVQFKASSGSVTASNRKLWVWAG